MRKHELAKHLDPTQGLKKKSMGDSVIHEQKNITSVSFDKRKIMHVVFCSERKVSMINNI
jgi:hypothetical protein